MSTAQSFEKTKAEVANKVRKLLTQAEDPAATADEARTFTMKAQQLMTKYSIELAMITDAASAGQLIGKSWTVEGPYAGHKVSLITAVARANECRAIYASLAGGRKQIDVVGYPADVDWVETLSRSLDVQLAGALRSAMADRPPHVHGRTYAVGFIEGFVAEVSHRLHDARRAAVAAAEASRHEHRQSVVSPVTAGWQPEPPATSVALVLVAKGKRVEEEFKVRHPHSRTVYSQVRLQSWSGYAPGRAAGSRASLARGSVGGTRRVLSA